MISTSWTVEAEDKLHRLLRDLPTAIQDPMTNSTEAAKQSFAMQRANILITAAIAKFALVSWPPLAGGTQADDIV